MSRGEKDIDERIINFGILKNNKIIYYLPLIVLALIIVIIGVFVPNFLTTRNMMSILRQSSALGVMAIGITGVLLGGGIDLSIPPVMAFGGIIGAMYMRAGGNPVIAGLIMIVLCTLFGSVNGFAIAYLKMIPFVVTLSTMYIATGASIWLTREVSIAGLSLSFINTVMANIWIIPVPVIFLIVITVISALFIKLNVYGRWLYAVGSNPDIARSMGIPKDKVIFFTYVFSGFFAGLAAIITTARLESASASVGRVEIIMNVLGSSVIGGVSVYGGVGSPLGAVLGAIFIVTITNIMTFMHVSYFMILFVKGIIIIAVVAIDSIRKDFRKV